MSSLRCQDERLLDGDRALRARGGTATRLVFKNRRHLRPEGHHIPHLVEFEQVRPSPAQRACPAQMFESIVTFIGDVSPGVSVDAVTLAATEPPAAAS
jgi:hypothetical protein